MIASFSIRVALIAVVICLQLLPSAVASDRIVMRLGWFQGDRDTIRRLIREDRYLNESFDATGQDEFKFAMGDLYIGRYDLNDDGKDELFVLIEHMVYCGTIGCTAYVYESENGQWKLLTMISVDQVTRDGQAYYLTSPKNFVDAFIEECAVARHHLSRIPAVNAGYRTLFGFQGGMYWNGKAYYPFCLYRCEPECG